MRLIKGGYSYYVEQVADLLGVDMATVRRWVREEGLERIPHARPHMIHSSALRAFLEKKQAKQKKRGAPHEVFCFRCQLPRAPEMESATIEVLPNTSIRFKAKCSVCGGKINKSIKGTDWGENHPLAKFLSDAPGEHNGVQHMHRKCSLHEEGSTCLNITP